MSSITPPDKGRYDKSPMSDGFWLDVQDRRVAELEAENKQLRARYRTIVADPPWQYDRVPSSPPSGRSKNVPRDGVSARRGPLTNKQLQYISMSVSEIAALPVHTLAADDCRLFLWTTNRYLPDAFDVLAAWGFTYRQTLVWHKKEGGPFLASIAPNTAEYLLVGTRGNPARIGQINSTVLRAPASRDHSTKPDAIIDLIEQASPGPYVELFARRARFGWDYWGNESLGTAQMEANAR